MIGKQLLCGLTVGFLFSSSFVYFQNFIFDEVGIVARVSMFFSFVLNIFIALYYVWGK
jgi:hypothetical protein